MGAGVGETVVAATVGALVAEVADARFASLTFRLRGTADGSRRHATLFPVITGVGPALQLRVSRSSRSLYRDLSPWTLPLFFVPALAAQRWFLMYQDQRRLADDLQGANDELRAPTFPSPRA